MFLVLLCVCGVDAETGDRYGHRLGHPDWEPMRTTFSAFASPDVNQIEAYRPAMSNLKQLLVDSMYTSLEARSVFKLNKYYGFQVEWMSAASPDSTAVQAAAAANIKGVLTKNEYDEMLPEEGEDAQSDLFRLFLLDTGLEIQFAKFLLNDEEEGEDGPDFYDVFLELGVLLEENGRVRSLVQIAPVADDLHIVTDFYQTSSQKYNTAENDFEAVMYIGMDSTALVAGAPRVGAKGNGKVQVLDLCCGSGVQGITAARYFADTLVSVDLNPRAIRFTRFNVIFNGFTYGRRRRQQENENENENENEASTLEVTVIHGSLYRAFDSDLNPAHIRGRYIGTGTNNANVDYSFSQSQSQSHWPVVPGPGEFDVILANPPYLPLKYDEGAMFGSGGPSGEDVTIKIVAGAPYYLTPRGRLTIVGNLMNVKTEDPVENPDYEAKLAKWWALGTKALDVGDGEEIEIGADGNAIPKVVGAGSSSSSSSSDTGVGMVEAAADAGTGFCIMQVYHGDLSSRSVYASSVKANLPAAERAKYEIELAEHGIESSSNGLVYLFRDPDLTQHHYNAEQHEHIWNVLCTPTNSSTQRSVSVRTRRLLGPEDAGSQP